MSALPPKADIRQRVEHVRFVPIADNQAHPSASASFHVMSMSQASPRGYLVRCAALLIAGLDAAQIGHVLELVGGDTGR